MHPKNVIFLGLWRRNGVQHRDIEVNPLRVCGKFGLAKKFWSILQESSFEQKTTAGQWGHSRWRQWV